MATVYCHCDVCYARGGRVVQAAWEHVYVKLGTSTGVLDLCDAHYEQLVLPVLEAIDDRKRIANGNRSGPFQCQVPGCSAAPLKHTGTMWQHIQGVHHITQDEYVEKYGQLVPMAPEERAVVEAKCKIPGCGKVYSTELGHRWPRGALISHLRGRHGLKADGKTPVR